MANGQGKSFGLENALIVADVQGNFSKKNPKTTKKINEFIEAMHGSMAVVMLRMQDKADWPMQYPATIHPNATKDTEFAVLPSSDPFNPAFAGDFALRKVKMDGFEDNYLATFLHSLNVKNTYTIGFDADQCVFATAMGAQECGFKSHIIRDLTAMAMAQDMSLSDLTAANMEKAGLTLVSSSALLPKPSIRETYGQLAKPAKPSLVARVIAPVRQLANRMV